MLDIIIEHHDELKKLLHLIIKQNQEIMATQAELTTQLTTIKGTVDQIAADIQPASTDADPALAQAVTDLGTSVDALRAKVPPTP